MWSPNPVVRDQRVMPLEGRRSMSRDVRDIGIGFHSGSLRISSRLNFRGACACTRDCPESLQTRDDHQGEGEPEAPTCSLDGANRNPGYEEPAPGAGEPCPA